MPTVGWIQLLNKRFGSDQHPSIGNTHPARQGWVGYLCFKGPSAESNVKSRLIILASSVFILTSCVVANRRGGGIEVIPILPGIVEIGDDSYYHHDGYHYFYSNNSWQYSTSRNGPRSQLPKSHWPRETRHRGEGHRNDNRSGEERRR